MHIWMISKHYWRFQHWRFWFCFQVCMSHMCIRLGKRRYLFYLGLSPNNKGARSSSRESPLGCWNSEMQVPWKDDMAVEADGLWSMLSTADVVNIPLHIIGGQTTPSSRYRWTTASPIWVDISRTLLYEIQIPYWNNVSISGRFLVLSNINGK